MQIAGSQCRSCNQPIVLGTEGKSCGPCAAAVHLHCEPAANCPVCGQPFDHHERPVADPLWSAYDPREKRSSNSVGLLLAALFSFLGTLLVFYLLTLT